MKRRDVVLYAYNALREVLDAYSGERFLVVCDDVKRDVGWVFAEAGLELGLSTRLVTLETKSKLFRQDLPEFLREVLVTGKPDLAVNCLRGEAEETPFRIKIIHLETRGKTTRLGHGPGITLDMLTRGALALSIEEYREMNSVADRVIATTEGAREIMVTTPGGTDLRLSIEGRGFFKDMTITADKWGNLPTGEVTVGPVENSLEGELVCDLAVGGIGLVKDPVAITCKHGEAVRVEGADEAVVAGVKEVLSVDRLASIVGEMAVGLNPKARMVQEFVEAEKISGTAHIAFGRNIDYPTGGKNSSANHMDFLMDKPTVTAVFPDKRRKEIVVDGKNVL